VPNKNREVLPGRKPRTVLTHEGEELQVPDDWELLEPGDATLTRRVKKAGPTWTVKVKKGRRTFSEGVWASARRIARKRAELAAERKTPQHATKLAAGRERREKVQTRYEQEFHDAVVEFLDFAECYQELAQRLAEAVTLHAIPVGSGTVARTQRIPIEDRARAAVIAWMRHQTTAYDRLHIPRGKGARREARRKLAAASFGLLERYRKGETASEDCPLVKALEQSSPEKPGSGGGPEDHGSPPPPGTEP